MIEQESASIEDSHDWELEDPHDWSDETRDDGSSEPMASSGGPPTERDDGSDPAKGSETSGAANVDQLSGTHNTVVGVHNEFLQHTYVVGIEEKVSQGLFRCTTRLTIESFEVFEPSELRADISNIVTEPEELQRLSDHFGARRILLLTGPESLGKGSLALKLAERLCRDLEGLRQIRRNREPLDRKLKVDLRSLMIESEELHGSVLILDGALHHENEDLLRFVTSIDSVALGVLERRLAKTHTVLILTCDLDRCPTLQPGLEERRKEAKGPTQDQLRSYLEMKATECIPFGDDFRGDLDRFLEDHGSLVTETLQTIPNLESFVRYQLLAVLRGELSLDVALRHVGQLDQWLLQDQSHDLQTLVYALALLACRPLPNYEVRWFHFQHLRRLLYQYMRRHLGKSEEAREVIEVCREPEIMRRLGVEVVRSPDGTGEIVRFQDNDRSEQLWATLLGAGRSLAALLVPFLQELSTSREAYLRQHAGWALGRISRLDSYGIFGSQFYRWSQTQSKNRLPPGHLGALCVGALLSGDRAVEDLCRQRLRAGVDAPEFDLAAAAISALGEVGQVDLDFALNELRRVVDRRLKPRLKRLRSIQKKHLNEESDPKNTNNSREARQRLAQAHDYEQAMKFVKDIFRPDKESRLLGSVDYSVTGLCFIHGSHPIIEQLQRWMPAGRETDLGPILSILFLRDGGIFHTLDRFPLGVENGGSQTSQSETWSRVLVSAAEAPNGLRSLARFLFGLHLGTASLPRFLRQILTKLFFERIQFWTRQAARGVARRNDLVSLWCLLLRLPNQDFRDRLNDLLDDPRLFEKGQACTALVEQIRRESAARRRRLTS